MLRTPWCEGSTCTHRRAIRPSCSRFSSCHLADRQHGDPGGILCLYHPCAFASAERCNPEEPDEYLQVETAFLHQARRAVSRGSSHTDCCTGPNPSEGRLRRP